MRPSYKSVIMSSMYKCYDNTVYYGNTAGYYREPTTYSPKTPVVLLIHDNIDNNLGAVYLRVNKFPPEILEEYKQIVKYLETHNDNHCDIYIDWYEHNGKWEPQMFDNDINLVPILQKWARFTDPPLLGYHTIGPWYPSAVIEIKEIRQEDTMENVYAAYTEKTYYDGSYMKVEEVIAIMDISHSVPESDPVSEPEPEPPTEELPQLETMTIDDSVEPKSKSKKGITQLVPKAVNYINNILFGESRK